MATLLEIQKVERREEPLSYLAQYSSNTSKAKKYIIVMVFDGALD